ncbi:MAG: 4Fe-4S dicluster domain-containing protein, partial [Gemmatimonadales bacterium]
MNYAWVLDQTKCIGCHACSTACKSENDVPVGVHRTWVKNVDVGSYPNVRRHFAVLRCNHCADPPCVDICPVTAMYQRSDGIVDIDHDRCIGCKACMQACPYDAIHVDPTDDTAAKCHFCAHRVDNGLLPSCVVVCPVEAIAFGDMGDPRSRVGKILGSTAVQVRKPEQGTQPKTFYVGAHAATLDPLAAYHDSSYMWADRKPGNAKDDTEAFSLWALLQPRNGNGKRNARDRMPPAKVSYDVHHEIPWRTKVSAYLWTKSISAGVMFVAALAVIGLGAADPTFTWWAP